MNILLVNAYNDPAHMSHSRNGMYAPLGILSLATYAKKALGDRISKIQVIDGDVESVDLADLEGFDVVGFYATTFNYLRTCEYAAHAKSKGATIVLGGPHGSILSRQIIKNKEYFDFVVREEGEIPFVNILQYLMGDDIDIKAVPNLTWRLSNGETGFNSKMLVHQLAELPIISRDYVPVELYAKNYREVYEDERGLIQGSLYSSKGCKWRDVTDGGCVFCARLEDGMRFRPIPQIWDEITYLHREFNVNAIWDIADDNLNSPKWFREFVDAKPKGLDDVSFFIYSRIGTVKEHLVPYFKKINVEEILVGVESGDNGVLRRSVKGQTVKSVRRALDVLRRNDISYFPTFVLGLPGESKSSLEQTYQLCQEIAEKGGANRIGVGILQPIPGCPAWYAMLEKAREEGLEFDQLDEIDMIFFERYWAKHFTEVEYETLVEYREKIEKLCENRIKVFGGRSDKSEAASVQRLERMAMA